MSPNLTGGWRDGNCSLHFVSRFAWRLNRTTVVSMATQLVLPGNQWTQNDGRTGAFAVCRRAVCRKKLSWGTVICGLLLFQGEVDVAAEWRYVQL